MTTRSPAWVAAAAVTAFLLNLTVLALLLPRPAVATGLATTPASTRATAGQADPLVRRGEYLARIGGCHDCHTEGFAEAGGEVPANRWLTGSSVGYKGAWGVSYPTNLRLSMENLTEAQWLVYARAQRLPPMPWFNLRAMSDDDLRALYRFIRALGPTGERRPAPVGPGGVVTTPFIVFEPQNLPVAARR